MNIGTSKLDIYTKQPDEILPIDISFGKLHILPRGATKIVSAIASAKRWKRKFPQNVEGANDFLVSTTPIILQPSETTVRITTTGGLDGYDYVVSLRVTFDNNAVLEDDIYIRVKDPIGQINYISDTPSGGFNLDRLDDVTITNPQNNQILRYNSATSRWENFTSTSVTPDSTDTLTNKRIQRRISSTISSSSLTPNISSFDFYEYTALAENLTVNNPIGTPVNGELLNFRFLDNGTGRTLTWGNQFRSMTEILPTTTVANKTHRILCEWNSTTSTWDCLFSLQS